NEPANVGRTEQLTLHAKRLLEVISALQLGPVRLTTEKEISALAELTFGKLFEHGQAVLHHLDVHERHELLPHAPKRESARCKLIARITLHHHDGAFESVGEEIKGDAGSDNTAANDDDDVCCHGSKEECQHRDTKTQRHKAAR